MVLNICDVSNSKAKNVTDIDAEVNYFNPRSRVKIGTWNVRTLYREGKIHNVIQEMKTRIRNFGM